MDDPAHPFISPMRKMKPPKLDDYLPTVLTLDELRSGEIHFARGQVRLFGKGRREQFAAISPRTVEALERYERLRRAHPHAEGRGTRSARRHDKNAVAIDAIASLTISQTVRRRSVGQDRTRMRRLVDRELGTTGYGHGRDRSPSLLMDRPEGRPGGSQVGDGWGQVVAHQVQLVARLVRRMDGDLPGW